MKKIATLMMLLAVVELHAQLNITIDGGSASALPIAIAPLVDGGVTLDTDIAAVISNDLARSGQFKVLDRSLIVEQPQVGDDIKYGNWRLLGVDYMSYGNVRNAGNGRIEIQYRLVNIADQKQLLSLTLPLQSSEARAGAHYIADRIYEAIIGVPGVFSTKIAYVTAVDKGGQVEYQLIVSDADGYAPQALVRSREPLLSPAWSPDARKLAYVSFEKGNSSIFIQDLATGQRQLMTNFKGINGAPKFSPDGRKLAITLSKGGNPDIYVLDIASKQLRQITKSWAIDTEPEWSVDGQSLLFTSDRGRKPQIYEANLNNNRITRVTFEGEYNARASLSPDGKNMAMVHGNNNRYRISVLHRPSGTMQMLSSGNLDETPTFAPNGSMVLYATKNTSGKGLLKAVSIDGQTTNELVLLDGNVREPSWSPILRR